MGAEIQILRDKEFLVKAALDSLKRRCYPNRVGNPKYDYWRDNVDGYLARELKPTWEAFYRYCEQLENLIDSTTRFFEKALEEYSKADQESASDIAN